jgi:hypothetical protein
MSMKVGEDSFYRRRRLGFVVWDGGLAKRVKGKYWAGLGMMSYGPKNCRVGLKDYHTLKNG